MNQIAADLILEQCATVGSGDLILIGALDGYGSYREAIQAGPVYYSVKDGDNNETGVGIFDGTNSIERLTVATTIFDGVYNNDNPRAIPLSGNAIVACTLNIDIFQQVLIGLEGKEGAFDKNTGFNKNFGETPDTVTEGFAKNTAFNKDFGEAPNTVTEGFAKLTAFNKHFGNQADQVCEGNDFRLSDDRDPNPHNHDAIYYQKDEYSAESKGLGSSNAPMITNVNGKLSTTFLEFNALTSQGPWTPTEGDEYPTLTDEPDGSFWVISDVDAIDGYTFLTGDLTGLVAKNSDVIILTINGWGRIKTNIVPEIYYRRDGEHALTAPLNAGNNLLSNVLPAETGTDGINLNQLTDGLRGKEDLIDRNTAFNKDFGTTPDTVKEGFSENTAFNKNFGDLAGTVTEGFSKNNAFNKNFGNENETVCEGNDPRLDDSRPPNPHDHDEQYFKQDKFVDQSLGAIDSGAPIKADAQGRLSTSFLDLSGIVFQGGWTPTAGDEYPDTGAVDAGAFWMIDEVPEPAGYTFVAGDLAGQTAYNGDIILFGARGWVLREVNLEPTAYYRLDGTFALIAAFQAGNQQLKNLANGSDGQDGVTVSQLATQIATREPTIFPKNSAFNKNFGTVAGAVCQGNDARLSNSRPPTAHAHPISDVTNLQVALNGKEPVNANIQTHIASRANPHAVTATHVGLGNCNNTSDANKQVSTATQTALDLKANRISPALAGTPTAPTAAEAANNELLANTAFVKRAVDNKGTDVIWAKFFGALAGTNPPESGSGIASITRINNGRFEVVFSIPQPDLDYSISALGKRVTGSDAGYATIPRGNRPSTTQFFLDLRDGNGNNQEADVVFLQVLR